MNVLLYPFIDKSGIAKYINIFEGWSKDNKASMFIDPRTRLISPLRVWLQVKEIRFASWDIAR